MKQTGNRYMGRIGKRGARRQGTTIVLMALMMTSLLGFGALAVDYGLMVADANRVQRACDAAALAGATELVKSGTDTSSIAADTARARALAVVVAARNKAPVNPNDVTFPTYNQIRVLGRATRPFLFGAAIGRSSGNLTRSASAGVAAGDRLSSGPGNIRVAPIGISWETYNAYNADRTGYHDIELVRQNKQTFGLNDAVLFDLRNNNAKSGAKMQDQLTGAETQIASIGDYETTLNAAQASEKKKLEDGLDILFDRSAQPPWNDGDSDNPGIKFNNILNGTAPRNNPRVVYVIVTPSTSNPSNGTYNTQVQGFVPVYIEDYYYENVSTGGKTRGKGSAGGSTEQVLRMRFRFLPPGYASDGSVTPNTGANLGGIRVVSLTG